MSAETTVLFRERLKKLDRDELLEIIRLQDPKYISQIKKIEYVFRTKMRHLTWSDGTAVKGRPFTNTELILLIDPPFIYDKEMGRNGFNEEQQRQIHIASDPILWAKHFLKDRPRAYQTLFLRDPNHRKVMRFGRRLGKALALDTPIPSPNGWTTMGDLVEGDQIFDEKGKICNVTFVTETMHNHDCYEVRFSDGSKIVADKDHQWTVETKQIRKNNARNRFKQLPLITVTTADILNNLNVGTKEESNYSIPVAGPLQYPRLDTPLSIDPYVLGFWLGDGSRKDSSLCIGMEDQDESRMNIEACGYLTKPRKDPIMFGVENLHKQLRLRGLFDGPEKFIPREFMEASVQERFELLKGLMDTDGAVTAESGQLEFCSSYRDLAYQVLELITSLGIKAHIYEGESWLNGVQHRNRFRIYFKTAIPVFKLSRKLDKQITEELPCQTRRYIRDIVKVDSVPVRCITVDSPNSLFLAGRNCIPTHNTRTMAFFCLWYAYTRQEAKVLILAPMKTHVGLIYDEVILLAKQNNLILPKSEDIKTGAIYRHVQSPQYQINFTNDAVIKFFTTGMKSNSKSDVARGQEADVIILDEMDYMGKEDLIALMAMQQTTSERNKDKKMMFGASTPTGQRSKFYDWNVDKKEGFSAFWFPSMVNPFWDQEMEDQMRNDYPNEQAYRHEIEADWGEDVEGVYPHKYLQVAFTDLPGVPAMSGTDDVGDFVPVGGWPYIAHKTSARSDFVFGIDWDKYTAGVNIVVLEICHDNYEIEEFQGKIRLAYREETAKSDFIYVEAVERVKELSEIFKPKWIYVDRGAGEVQVELLHQYGKDHPETRLHKIVKGVQFAQTIEVRDPATKLMTKKDIKPFMVDNLYQMLEEQRIKFPAHDEELHLVLMSYIVERISATGRPVFAAGGNTVDHQHDALILACYAIADNFDDLLNPIFATKPIAISNAAFLPTFELTNSDEIKIAEETWGANKGPVVLSRPMAYNVRQSGNKPFTRKMF